MGVEDPAEDSNTSTDNRASLKYEEWRELARARRRRDGIFLRASEMIHSDSIRCMEHRNVKIMMLFHGRSYERFSSTQT
jgi:hypothetical protein